MGAYVHVHGHAIQVKKLMIMLSSQNTKYKLRYDTE